VPRRRTNLTVAIVAVVALVIVAFVLIPRSGTPAASATPSPTAAAGTTPPAGTIQPTGTTGASASPRPAITHVWWIVMENHEYGSVIGNPSAPYLNGLASKYDLLTNFYATVHPSEPNYIALVAGSTLGVNSDGTYDLAGPSLFSQLASAGKTWRAYEQDYPGGCFTGGSASGAVDGPGVAGSYARKHDPAISFTSVSAHPAQCASIQPLHQFDPAAAAFEFITPNLINDMHDGSPAQGDAFLRAFVPLITGSPAFATGVLFITFDEGSSGAGSHGDGGGHVATLVLAPGVAPGSWSAAYADHYSLLRTTQDLLGLPCLATSCSRTSITY
jgi:phosphatidylinositol-3-phosphatase